MESDARVLTLLFLAAVASGCTHSGGTQTVTEGPESVMVQELSITPSEIYSGQSVRASLTAINAGNTEAEVLVGEKGRKVLLDYCPDIFTNKKSQYSASSTRVSQNQESYSLKPGEKVNIRWLLEAAGNVPLIGYQCDMKFAVPFNYSVKAYRQVQIKNSEDVEGSEKLQSESSSGPMVLAIEALPGATGRPGTYVSSQTGDDTVNFLVQLVNRKPKEEYRKGLVNIDKSSFYIRASEPLQLDETFRNGEWVAKGYEETRCEVPDRKFRLIAGRSINIRCSVPIGSIDSPSALSEITAGVNYTYIKDAGERTVKVKTRG